jgi:16S rRNA processing protein RimM
MMGIAEKLAVLLYLPSKSVPMIKKEDVIKIGRLNKPHGIQGEISFEFENDIFEDIDFSCVILELDGILVPFFVNSYRLKDHENGLIMLDGVRTEEDAKELIKADMFILISDLPENLQNDMADNPDYFIGYTILDEKNETIGKIISVDDSTENILWNIISGTGDEILIPVNEEFIIKIDDYEQVLTMRLPEGLLDLFE